MKTHRVLLGLIGMVVLMGGFACFGANCFQVQADCGLLRRKRENAGGELYDEAKR